VLDVVGLQVARAPATREAAALVTSPQVTRQPGRNAPAGAADTQGTGRAFGHDLDTSVAGKPSGHGDGEGWAILEVGSPLAVCEDTGVDVDHHCRPSRVSIGCQAGGRKLDQGV
jgi:hypothetical protein